MIFLATNLTYFMANAFLDPRSNYLGRRPPIPEEQVTATLAKYNLNDKEPILERWWNWLTDIFTSWNWGMSPTGVSVNSEVGYRVMTSAQLMLGATLMAAILGVAIGVFTASRQYSWADRFFQGLGIISMNTHTVVASLVLVLAALKINAMAGTTVFFVTGSGTTGATGFDWFVDKVQHLTLPTLSLIFISYAGYHFTQRSLLLDNLEADYVRTVRAKGLTRSQAIRKHALRTSIIPVATSFAFSIPGIFTGAVITESVFAWKGMGQYFIQTITQNDIHGVVAVAAFSALMTAIGAILSDILVVFLDPRVRVS